MNERGDEIVSRWFGRTELIENTRITKRVYESKRMGKCLVGSPQNSSTEPANDSLKIEN